jgi:hypothetical protein
VSVMSGSMPVHDAFQLERLGASLTLGSDFYFFVVPRFPIST